MPPRVSVVMPVYRCERYIGEAIESILNQGFRDFEFIIISDDSTPEMKKILEKYESSDTRLKIIHQERKGYFYSRNQSCKLAKGEFIAIMDCDDVSTENRLQSQVVFLDNNPDIGVVGSWYNIIDEKGIEIGKRKYPISAQVVRWNLLFGNAVGHGTVMVRRDLLEEVKYYNSGPLGFCEDYDLWARSLKISEIANIPEYLLHYRMRRGSITSDYESCLISSTIDVMDRQITQLLGHHTDKEILMKLYRFRGIQDYNEGRDLIQLILNIFDKFCETVVLDEDERKLIRKDISIRICYIALASARTTRLRSLLFFIAALKINPLAGFDLIAKIPDKFWNERYRY